MTNKCISCGRDITTINNSVAFNCLKCGKPIIRCGECRSRAVPYKHECGFKGI